MQFRLVFLGMPLAPGFGRNGILFMLRNISASPVFADTKTAIATAAFAGIKHLSVIVLGTVIPAGIDVPAELVGDLVHFGSGVRHRRPDGRASGVFARGNGFDVLQLAMRVIAASADLVVEAPREDGRMVDVLAD